MNPPHAVICQNIVMTKSTPGSARQPCQWCRFPFTAGQGPGRPRKFCSQRCRQWDWVARQRARELELSEDQLIVTRGELDRLRDDLYVLQCALQDAEQDLALDLSISELREVVRWVLDAAEPLRRRPELATGDSMR